MDRRNILGAILLLLLLVLILSFPEEVVTLLRWLEGRQTPSPTDVSHALLVLGVNIVCFVLFYLIWLLLVSTQAIFPVTQLREVAQTALYLTLFCLGWHGMAAYVRNGKIKAYVEELQRPLPGAVAVDFNSALAVERIVLPPGLLRLVMQLFRGLVSLFRINSPLVRSRSAGLIFTLPDERIYGVNDLENYPVVIENDNWMNRILGVVDLRPQFRISIQQPHPLSKRLGKAVFAYTRDGIEVKTHINIMATLGQDPTPINVTYFGDRDSANLKVVKLKKVEGRTNQYEVESLTDELDEADRREIHEQWRAIPAPAWVSYEEPPRPPVPELPVFNQERVLAAVYARARYHRGFENTDEIVPWCDLPIHVAIDLFRELVSHYNYDELYTPNTRGKMGADQLRAEFGAAVQNSSLLSCRPIFHRTGAVLEEGQLYPAVALCTVPPAAAIVLRSPGVLRERGIRVIRAGFGGLDVDERIYRQRLDNWRAVWERDTEVLTAGLEWESLRVRTRARIRAQQEFVQTLGQIYQSNTNSREILALQVLQALEAAAADPKTRQLLPDDTFSMLRSVHDWLLPQDMGYPVESKVEA